MKTIFIKRIQNGWAVLLPEYPNQWIPAPFTSVASFETVKSAVSQRNPSYQVEALNS